MKYIVKPLSKLFLMIFKKKVITVVLIFFLLNMCLIEKGSCTDFSRLTIHNTFNNSNSTGGSLQKNILYTDSAFKEFMGLDEKKYRFGVTAGLEYFGNLGLDESNLYFLGCYYKGVKRFQLNPSLKIGILQLISVGNGEWNFFSTEAGISPGLYFSHVNIKLITSYSYLWPLEAKQYLVPGIDQYSDFMTKGFSIMPSPGVSLGRFDFDTYLGLFFENKSKANRNFLRAGLSLGCRIL